MTTNPLLQKSSAQDQAHNFGQVQVEHYMPALNEAIVEAKKKIELIKNEKETSFANTVLALEEASENVDRVSGLYFNLFSAEASEAHQALAQQISPVLSAYASDISLDDQLFQKIKFVYEHRTDLKLTGENLKLTEKVYLDFARNGALLDSTKKDQLRALDQKLSVLSP